MKNPFARKKVPGRKNSKNDFEVRGVRPVGSTSDRRTASNGIETSPTIKYSWTVNPVDAKKEAKKDLPKGRSRGVGRLVRKLKCAMSTKKQASQDRRHRRDEASSMHSQPRSVRRPVMITVKNKESGSTDNSTSIPSDGSANPYDALQNFAETCAPACRFPLPSSIQPSTKRQDTARSSTSFKSSGGRSYTKRVQLREPVDSLASRKERWLRGLQHGWTDDDDQPSLVSGEDSLGVGSLGYDTDLTTEVSSDESDSFVPVRRNQNVVSSTNRRRNSSGLKRPLIAHDDTSMWASVAEDMSIVAGLLLSDGKACFGSVADITRETVADTCRAPASFTK